MNDRAWCSQCSQPHCSSVGWRLEPCSKTKDAECVQCRLAFETGAIWTAGSAPCNFTCGSKYFKPADGGGCLPCSKPICSNGMRLSACTATSDTVCVACDPPASGLYVWGGECQFACAGGYFRSGMVCAPCTSIHGCAPGFRPSECSPLSDARCIACGGWREGMQWTGGCDFTCLPSFYRVGSGCMPCSVDATCPPGFRLSECGGSLDSACIECTAPGSDGTYAWVGPDCEFVCLNHPSSSNSTSCLPSVPEQPMAYVVVSTALSMNNTAESVCTDLDVLLRALSDAMARVNECGCMYFVTNVTSFDGATCIDNMCPQCGASGVRRLLSDSKRVDLVTVSTSLEPVTLSVVQQAQSAQPSELLQTELATVLASKSSNLMAFGVVAAVYSIPVRQSAPLLLGGDSWKIFLWTGLALSAIVLSFMLCAIVCMLNARTRRAAAVRRMRLKETSVRATPEWMSSIRLRERAADV